MEIFSVLASVQTNWQPQWPSECRVVLEGKQAEIRSLPWSLIQIARGGLCLNLKLNFQICGATEALQGLGCTLANLMKCSGKAWRCCVGVSGFLSVYKVGQNLVSSIPISKHFMIALRNSQIFVDFCCCLPIQFCTSIFTAWFNPLLLEGFLWSPLALRLVMFLLVVLLLLLSQQARAVRARALVLTQSGVEPGAEQIPNFLRTHGKIIDFTSPFLSNISSSI